MSAPSQKAREYWESHDGEFGRSDLDGFTLELREALRGLADRLKEIGASDAYRGQVAMSNVHGFEYDGPTWVEPLERALSVLTLYSPEEERGGGRGESLRSESC